jgi:regulation of enolase protein 1 (concanavalin A-like superfamily)
MRADGLRMVLLMGALLAAGLSPARAQGDEFDAVTLGPQWFWIREDPSYWSLRLRPGCLRVTTQQGDLAGTLYFNARNLLLQGTRSGDFEIETHLWITPSYDYQQGGLLVYENDDNYVKLARSHVLKDGGNVIELVKEVAGKLSVQSLRIAATEIYLRLTKTGNSYKAEYSYSGKPAEWFVLTSTTNDLSELKVGLIAISGPLPNVPEIPVDFDFFRGRGAGFGTIVPAVVGTPRIGSTVFVDLAAEPDAFYYLGAALGTQPGIPLGNRTVPLNPDPLLVLTVGNRLSSLFHHFAGYLGARGEARAWIDIPADVGLVGVEFHLAFVTIDSGKPFGIGTISDAVKVEITS